MPKASLLRILKTLALCGEVERRAADGLWLPVRARGGAGNPRDVPRMPARPQTSPELSSVLGAALARLAAVLPWPSDVAVRHGLKMVVVNSNRAAYGRAWKRSVAGMEIDLLDSAMGRAWLAHCPIEERAEVLERLLSVDSPRRRKRESIVRELAQTRDRGFALRDPFYAGPDANDGDQLSSFAVPVQVNSRVVACVSCVWLVATASRAAVIERCLASVVREAAIAGGQLGAVRS